MGREVFGRKPARGRNVLNAGRPFAAEGIARQPEAAATIQTAAIILAALVEGAALFGLVITLLYKLLP